MLILGAHVSIGGGFAEAAEKIGKEYRCNAMQIFTKSPQGGPVKPIDQKDAERFKELCAKYGIKFVVAHSSYLLNFGKSLKSAPWMRQNLVADFERLHMLGGHGVVVHIGKALDGTGKNGDAGSGAASSKRTEAIKNVIENAKEIIEATQKTGLEYILENTAGQGSELGYRFEELGQIWKGLRAFSPRLRSCLDTAHAWGAGYDIGNGNGASETLKIYDELVGLDTLACFHFNDSKKACGSRVDRHDNIGDGLIGLDGLSEIAKFAAEKSIPLILETPEKEGRTRLEDIRKTRAMLH